MTFQLLCKGGWEVGDSHGARTLKLVPGPEMGRGGPVREIKQ